MIAYIIQVLLFQVLFLAVYDFFLSKETFHNYNRWYLLGTPMISFVLPLIKIPTFQKAIPEYLMVYFPEIMLSPQKVIEQTAFYREGSVNYISLLFWCGVVLFALVFLVKLYKIFRLISINETIQKIFYKLVLLPKQSTAFSFFHFIFLGKNISKEKQEDIIQHELIHSKQMHSLDLLFFEFLRIAMWFNPMIYIYQQRITLLHEYISDAEVVKTTEKHDYFNKLLSQTFQVENISFVNQFYKHSLIKKRITMMTKNKSKQIRKAKYLLLLPLLASMLFYTSCGVYKKTSTVIEVVEVEVVEIEEVYEDVPFAIVEEVPVLKKPLQLLKQ
jgi:bla regulator protein BlaR1